MKEKESKIDGFRSILTIHSDLVGSELAAQKQWNPVDLCCP